MRRSLSRPLCGSEVTLDFELVKLFSTRTYQFTYESKKGLCEKVVNSQAPFLLKGLVTERTSGKRLFELV